jgi:hypothetical protein
MVRPTLDNRSRHVFLYDYRPRSKTRRDAHLLAARRTRQATQHLPIPFPASNAPLMKRDPSMQCDTSYRYRNIVQRSSFFLRMLTRPCHGSVWCPRLARSRRGARGRTGRSASVRRLRRKMLRCALVMQMSCSSILWSTGGFLSLERCDYDPA